LASAGVARAAARALRHVASCAAYGSRELCQ
jgi:hypothetical protein